MEERWAPFNDLSFHVPRLPVQAFNKNSVNGRVTKKILCEAIDTDFVEE